MMLSKCPDFTAMCSSIKHKRCKFKILALMHASDGSVASIIELADWDTWTMTRMDGEFYTLPATNIKSLARSVRNHSIKLIDSMTFALLLENDCFTEVSRLDGSNAEAIAGGFWNVFRKAM